MGKKRKIVPFRTDEFKLYCSKYGKKIPQMSRLHKILIRKNIVIRIDADSNWDTVLGIMYNLDNYLETSDFGRASDIKLNIYIIYE